MLSEKTFIEAVQNNNLDYLKKYLCAGGDVNAVVEGTTALYEACKNNHSQAVRLLLEAGADVNKRTNILLDKENSKYAHLWREYLACWVHWKDFPLMVVCENGNRELAEMLLTAGAEVNVARVLHIEAFGGRATGDMPDACHILTSPLKWAVERGDKAWVQLLLKYTSGKGLSLQEAENPLEAAARCNQEFVNMLLDAGYGWAYGGDDLITAAKRGDISLVFTLLERRIPVDSATALGKTALMWAVQNNNVPLVIILLQAGADGNKKDSNGQSAKDIARSAGNKLMLEVLEGAEASRR